MSPEARLAPLLVRQDGLVTLAQAVDAGVSPRTVQRRVRSGGWERVLPRVFLVAGHPRTDAVRVRATALWVGAPGAVSGPAAAWWHGMLQGAPDIVELTVPRDGGPRPQPNICLRRRTLASTDLAKLRGLWLTDKPLTALETAAAIPEGSTFLDRALQRHVSFPRVYRAYCRNLGAHGSGRAGTLLVAAADRADSAAERRAVALMRAAGITGWVLGHPFGRYRIDIAFPEEMLAIEIDGWAWHMDVDRFRADRHKGNALVRARWDLLRFTWHDLTNRPDYVVAEIRAALAARGDR
ncbi:MAG TPA: type IV toxin-antitoxin system AbiEi family antitoxin domain-containing protein [Pseudonocardia sp.]|nr:type IV toxin-antitoxin system AbiEi family antitoxin domain-containing protein [Pseudonocardia sp.]